MPWKASKKRSKSASIRSAARPYAATVVGHPQAVVGEAGEHVADVDDPDLREHDQGGAGEHERDRERGDRRCRPLTHAGAGSGARFATTASYGAGSNLRSRRRKR